MPTSGGLGPASDPQSNQGDASDARYWYCNAGELFTEQQLPDQRRNDQQPQSGSDFGDGGENQRIFHRRVINFCGIFA
jgi:hypothetical protein